MSSVVIGREHEIAEADGFLDEAAERARGLLLVGEPGIGKTTLWSAVVESAARRGHDLLVARPSEAEAGLAFGVLTDLFAGIDEGVLGEIPSTQRAALEAALRRDESDVGADPTAIALATLGVLRRLAASRPTVVAVDDLQWADAPSLRALTFAFRRLDESPVGLLATVRSEHDSELTRLAAREEHGLDRVDVMGLGERELAQLVFERTGRAFTPPQLARLAELSGGNPFYALELAATGDPELAVPETLVLTLQARLASLSGAARAAGQAAATLGRIDERVLRDDHREGLAELRAAGVVVVRSGTATFAHPLLASALLALQTAAERRAVHLALAERIDDPEERAVHLARGTEAPNETVATELERAAGSLDARGAPETAASLAERAAALTPDSEPEARTRRLLRAADLYQAAGEGGLHVLPLLQQLADTLPRGPGRAAVLLRLGWLGAQMDTLSASEAIAHLEDALTEAGGAADVAAPAHAALARLRGNGGDYRAAHRHAELAVASGPATGPGLMFPAPLGELAIARFMTGHGFDDSLLAGGLDLESRHGPVGEPYQSTRLQLGLALLYAGELTRARTVLHELLDRSRELGRVHSTAGCVLHLTELEVRAGRLADAEAHAIEFVHLDRQLRGDQSGEWYPSGLVGVALGRVEDARRILDGGIAYSRSIESTIWLARQLWALGHLELSLGQLAAARDALVPLVPLLRETGLGEWSAHPVHPDAIEALVGLGELDEAAALTTELEEYAQRLDRPWGLATAARSAALVASARGEHQEALEAVQRALEEHRRLDWPLEHARTLLVAGGILRRLGRRRDAAGRLAEARAALVALRSPLWLARVEAEEQRLGGRRGAGDRLTPTEERVAALAGQGLRNAEIATRLYVTPKTVEATLSRVYRKLAVRSRTELSSRLAGSASEVRDSAAAPSSSHAPPRTTRT